MTTAAITTFTMAMATISTKTRTTITTTTAKKAQKGGGIKQNQRTSTNKQPSTN